MSKQRTDEAATAQTEDEMIAEAQRKLVEQRAKLAQQLGANTSSLTSATRNPIEPRGACLGCRGVLEDGRLFVCVACERLTEQEQQRRAMRDAAEACEARLKRSALPRDYALFYRNRSHLTARQTATLEQVASLTEFYMHGPAGAGKTSVGCVLLAEMIRDGATGMYVVTPDLMSDLRVIYAKGSGSGLSSSTLIDPLIETDCLLLDDIGKEKPSDHSATVLFELLDNRYRRRRPGRWTGILSNYAAHEIGARFNDPDAADPLVRRMTDGAKVIAVRS